MLNWAFQCTNYSKENFVKGLRLAVSTRSNCYIYNFPKIKLAKTIHCFNPEGIIALTSNIDFKYFAYVDRAISTENKLEDKVILFYVPDLLDAK